MPNHVTNILSIMGPEDLVKRIKSEVSSVYEDGSIIPLDFSQIAPLPDELKGTTSPAKIISQKEYEEQEARIAAGDLGEFERNFGLYRGITKEMSERFIEEYGFDNWYDWQMNAWGTKWNAYSHEVMENGDIRFKTAWSSPVRLIIILSAKYPEASFKVRYADEDFGYNVGQYICRGGDEMLEKIPKGGSHEAYMLAADILDEWDYLVQRLEGIEEEDIERDYVQAMIGAVYQRELIGDYPEQVWKRIQEISIRNENYEFAQKIKEHLEKSAV